ncbi:MAG TPA: hypothetical protein VN806_06640 [Caulobacteraceae bacterium]|jgi:hypothetical protein|nr:hypothetical protein [Caulobacteraceae bacterium]
MKRVIIGAAVALTTVFSVSAAYAHVCYAHSRVAYGWGSSPYLGTAKVIALRECAVRTPRGLVCYITSCR